MDRSKDNVVAVATAGDAPNTETSVSVPQGFGQFYKCAKFSDVSLLDGGGNRIAAHRLVLSAGSKKFNELLSHDSAIEVHCMDIEPCCLHAMLEYLYTSHCNIQVHNAVQLLAAAMLYGCDELESMASLYIHMQLNANTCCFFFSEAQKHKVEHIAIKALYVASLDFQNVIKSQSFFELSLENLTAMLGSPKLGAIHKPALCKAGCAWMTKDPARLEKLNEILMCIQTRASTPSDDLQLIRFLNAPDGGTSTSEEHGDEMEWTSAERISTTSAVSPFASKRSADLGTQKSVLQNAGCPAQTELHSGRRFLKDIKSDDGEMSADAARHTSATTKAAFFADHLKKSEQQQTKSSEMAEFTKTQPTEDNASSEASSTRRPRCRRERALKGVGKPGQQFTCQVEGCTTNLQGLKEYHIRYKICHHHLKVGSIIKDGEPQRFCQQCGRFHPLDKFDNNKRSCRERLLRHNMRRRKRLIGHKTAGQTPLLSMQQVGFQPQHVVYLPTTRDADAHSTNLEKLYTDGRQRCLQLVSPADMNQCLMFSPVPRSIDRDPLQQKQERTHSVTENETNNNASHRPSYVKPDPGTERSGTKNGL